jgi:hypothetical protein
VVHLSYNIINPTITGSIEHETDYLLSKHFDVEIADFEMEDETLPEAIWIYEKGKTLNQW